MTEYYLSGSTSESGDAARRLPPSITDRFGTVELPFAHLEELDDRSLSPVEVVEDLLTIAIRNGQVRIARMLDYELESIGETTMPAKVMAPALATISGRGDVQGEGPVHTARHAINDMLLAHGATLSYLHYVIDVGQQKHKLQAPSARISSSDIEETCNSLCALIERTPFGETVASQDTGRLIGTLTLGGRIGRRRVISPAISNNDLRMSAYYSAKTLLDVTTARLTSLLICQECMDANRNNASIRSDFRRIRVMNDRQSALLVQLGVGTNNELSQAVHAMSSKYASRRRQRDSRDDTLDEVHEWGVASASILARLDAAMAPELAAAEPQATTTVPDEVQAPRRMSITTRPRKAGADSEEVRDIAPDPELLRRYTGLWSDYNSLVEPFTFSNKAIRNTDLMTVFNDLFRNHDDMSKPDVYRVLSVFNRLQHELVDQDPVIAQAGLAYLCAKEQDIVQDMGTVRSSLPRSGDITPVASEHLNPAIVWLAAHHESFGMLLIDHLGNDATDYVNTLARFFGPITETTGRLTEAQDEGIVEIAAGLVNDATDVVDKIEWQPDSVPDTIPESKSEPVVLEVEPVDPVLGEEHYARLAEQLGIVVFPNNGDHDTLRQITDDVNARITDPADRDQIEWWRIELLHRFAQECGGQLYRTSPPDSGNGGTNENLGEAYPWYVAHIQIKGAWKAIVEHPLSGRATYIIEDEYTNFWQEMVTLFRRDAARALGANRAYHPERTTERPDLVHEQALRARLGV